MTRRRAPLCTGGNREALYNGNMENKQPGFHLEKRTIALIALAVLIVAAGVFVRFYYGNWTTYRDGANQVQFTYPKKWSAGSSAGFVKLLSDQTRPEELNVLIKVAPVQFFVDGISLGDGAERIKIGDKDMAIAHMEAVVPGGPNQATSTITYTHLYWKDASGRGYIFEISPWQKDGLNKDLQRFLKSFEPI